MFNVHIDVRGPYPVLFHGFRSFKLENFTRNVTVEEAVDFLQADGQINNNDPLVVMVDGWRHARNS